MTQYNYSDAGYSDLHKDVYGFRPRGLTEFENTHDKDRKQQIWNDLVTQFDRQLDEKLLKDTRARISFENKVLERIVERIESGRPSSRVLAVVDVVLGDSRISTDSICFYGGEYVCYELGLPYDMHPMLNDIFEQSSRMKELRERFDEQYTKDHQ